MSSLHPLLVSGALAIALLSGGGVSAQLAEQPPAGTAAPHSRSIANARSAAEPLTLADVVDRAKRFSPRLRKAASIADQSRAATSTAHAYTNPSIEIFEGQQYARAVPTPGVPGLLQHYAVYQTMEVPSERRTRIRVASLAEAAGRSGQVGLTLSVIAEAKHAFYTVLRRREEIEHSQENLQIVEDLRRRVQVEVDTGEKGKLELTRAEAEVAQARFAVRRAQLEFADSVALLRLAISAPADETLDPQGSVDPRVSLPALPDLRELVLQTHPSLTETQTNIQAAEANVSHEKALRVPQPTFFAEYENQPDLRFWRAGVTVPLPLWDRRKGRVESAKAGVSEQNAVLDQRRLELISATERAYEAYQLADQQAEALQSGELHSAESAVTAAQTAYRFGERGIVEVLDAQRVLQSVRDDLLDAQYARQAALIDLQELGAVPAPEGRP